MATYYVGYDGSGVLGNDANPGTSFAQRKATFAAGVALLANPGDVLVVCASWTYQLSVSASVSLSSTGSSSSPLIIAGGNPANLGAQDGTVAWIDGGNTATYCLQDHASSSRPLALVQNLGFRRATSHGVAVLQTNSRGWAFIDCQATANGGAGFYGLPRQCAFKRCKSFLNTGDGITTNGSIDRCEIYSNSGKGVSMISSAATRALTLLDSRIYGNTGIGVEINVAGTDQDPPCKVHGNTVYNNGSHGVCLTGASGAYLTLISSNILASNAGYGVTCSAGTAIATLDRNHYHGNSSGTTNGISAPGNWSESASSGNPAFADAGSGDFRPLIGSPAIRSDGSYAGAVSPYRRDMVRARSEGGL